MRSRWVWGWVMGLTMPGTVAHAHHPGGGLIAVPVPFALGSPPYLVEYSPRLYYSTFGPDGRPLTYTPPVMIFTPSVPPPLVGPSGAPVSPNDKGMGAAGPWPPVHSGFRLPRPAPDLPKAAAKKSDPTRSSQLVTIGDRLFRAGNTRRAAERYEQAVRAEPDSAAPRIRLAQVALVRGQFSEAANRLREALIAEPGWLTTAPDVESLYSEPGDFARTIAKLESHLQANPSDRDAWLVLGAQWYLSGRTRRAADIFLRLSDRKPDPTLAAFLDATTPADQARR